MTPDQIARNLADAIWDQMSENYPRGLTRSQLDELTKQVINASLNVDAWKAAQHANAVLSSMRGVQPPIALDARSWIKAVRS